MQQTFVNLATLAVMGVVFSCRTSPPADSTDLKAGQSSVSAPSECREINPVSSEAMNGQQIFNLTSVCLFNRDVHEVRIKILSETFQKVLNDGCSGRESGYGHVIELILDGKSIKDVGIKVRGNTSACNVKRQFRFKFDADEVFSVWLGQKEVKKFPRNADRTFFGLSGISLRASQNDPSMVRERVSSRIFTHAESIAQTAERGGLVYRLSFANFFVSFNRTEGAEGTFTRQFEHDPAYYDYKGFYSLAENIDKVFVRSRFQKGDTKLKDFYLYQADLAMAHYSRNTYTRRGWPAEYVEGSKPKEEKDFKKGDEKLFELFDFLASESISEEEISKKIDVDSMINYYASALLAGHWDSLLSNANNDWLYFNGDTKKWQLFAWDLDNSLGAGDHDGFLNDNIYDPSKQKKSLIFMRLFDASHPGIRTKLKNRLKQFIRGGFYSAEKFNPMIDEVEATARGAVEIWEGLNPRYFNDIKNFSNSRRRNIDSQL